MYEYHFRLMACCYNISIYHRFRDINTFPVYVTACDLEKFFTFDNKFKSQAACTFQFMCKYTVVKTRYICKLTGVTKV